MIDKSCVVPFSNGPKVLKNSEPPSLVGGMTTNGSIISH